MDFWFGPLRAGRTSIKSCELYIRRSRTKECKGLGRCNIHPHFQQHMNGIKKKRHDLTVSKYRIMPKSSMVSWENLVLSRQELHVWVLIKGHEISIR